MEIQRKKGVATSVVVPLREPETGRFMSNLTPAVVLTVINNGVAMSCPIHEDTVTEIFSLGLYLVKLSEHVMDSDMVIVRLSAPDVDDACVIIKTDEYSHSDLLAKRDICLRPDGRVVVDYAKSSGKIPYVQGVNDPVNISNESLACLLDALRQEPSDTPYIKGAIDDNRKIIEKLIKELKGDLTAVIVNCLDTINERTKRIPDNPAEHIDLEQWLKELKQAVHGMLANVELMTKRTNEVLNNAAK